MDGLNLTGGFFGTVLVKSLLFPVALSLMYYP